MIKSLKSLFAVAFILVMNPTGFVAAQELDFIPTHKFSVNAWKPAPTPEGAVAWSTLMDITTEEKGSDYFLTYTSEFTDKVRELNGKRIKINGYMLPIDAGEMQSHFILQAYSLDCPFHMPGGPGGYIEVKADFPVKFSYEPVVIEGEFVIDPDFQNGVFYHLRAAKKDESAE